MKRTLALICVLFLFACAKPAFKDEFESDKPWVEQLTQLPAYPDEKNLMAFDAGAVSDNQYFVDTTSIKIGEDGVIRFSLVIKSSAGALNVSYEGIRCATRERKAVSYTHLRAHETVLDLVCRLLLEKKKNKHQNSPLTQAATSGASFTHYRT